MVDAKLLWTFAVVVYISLFKQTLSHMCINPCLLPELLEQS